MATLRQQILGEPLEGEDVTSSEGNWSVSYREHASYSVEYLTDSAGDTSTGEAPIEYQHDNPVVNPAAMFPGVLYPFMLFGKWACALKEEDGTINLFYVPESA